MSITKILLANDGSEGAFKALGVAVSLAKHYIAELHMICVEELPMLPTAIDEVIEEREEANHRYEKVIERSQSLCYMQDVDGFTHVVYGHPVPSIIDFIQKHDIDHLVIGFMGHSALYNRIIGSKSDKLVRLAPCSITVVK
jgi:nucleotide-binding universal stress UspA family protein